MCGSGTGSGSSGGQNVHGNSYDKGHPSNNNTSVNVAQGDTPVTIYSKNNLYSNGKATYSSSQTVNTKGYSKDEAKSVATNLKNNGKDVYFARTVTLNKDTGTVTLRAGTQKTLPANNVKIHGTFNANGNQYILASKK